MRGGAKHRKYESCNWVYGYDRKYRVWRAFRGNQELNAFRKHDLQWLIDHVDIQLLQVNGEIPDNVVVGLSVTEKQEFLEELTDGKSYS